LVGDDPPEIGEVVLENNTELGLDRDVILLGETKYYAAARELDPTDPEMKKEVLRLYTVTNFDETGKPLFRGHETEVRYATALRSGEETATLYHGKKWPRWESDAVRMMDLDEGLIRIIGRYWKEGSEENKVNLWVQSTTKPDLFGKRLIEVKKPEKLHDPRVFNKPFDVTWNIRNELLNIDELCIEYGGKIGISPQIIKGQMFQESDKTGDRFNPSYRYEPWADYGFAHGEHAKDYAQQPFCVTGQPPKPMGEGKDIPLDHQNVKPVYYPTSPVSIAEYAISNWGKYWDSEKLTVVGSTDGPDNLTDRWRNYLIAWYAGYSTIGQDPSWLATRLLYRHIRQKYVDYAQTRKAASYGLIQMLYTTALVQGYNKGKSISTSQAPEELNDETIEMPFYQTFTDKNLRLQFGGSKSIVPNANWPKGWEQTWKDSFKKYNKHPGYGVSVFKHARKFHPQPKQGVQ